LYSNKNKRYKRAANSTIFSGLRECHLNFFGVKSTPDLLAREKKTEQSAGQICSPSVSVSKSVCACVCVCVGQLQNLLLLLALAKIMGDFIMALQFAVPPQKNKKKS